MSAFAIGDVASRPSSSPSDLAFNYRYVIDRAVQVGGRALDYGCGTGLAIAYGRSRGLDIVGTDTFEGAFAHWRGEGASGTAGYIHPIVDGRAPFPADAFDCVISNQVLEHVREPALVIADMRRVLKPGGLAIVTFPSREAWWEGHVGVYFAHRLQHYPALRRRYLDLYHRLGLGWFRENKTREEWVAGSVTVLDTACFYHRARAVIAEVERVFGGPVRDLSADYMRARFGAVSRLMPSAADSLLRFAYRVRAGVALEVRKASQ